MRVRAPATDLTIHKADAFGGGGRLGWMELALILLYNATHAAHVDGRREERAVIKEKCMKAAGGGVG